MKKRPKILFDHNWNNKLNCKVFVEIRLYTAETHAHFSDNFGKVFDVRLSGKVIKQASLTSLDIRRMGDVPHELINLDLGVVSISEEEAALQKKGIYRPNQKVLVLMFREPLPNEL